MYKFSRQEENSHFTDKCLLLVVFLFFFEEMRMYQRVYFSVCKAWIKWIIRSRRKPFTPFLSFSFLSATFCKVLNNNPDVHEKTPICSYLRSPRCDWMLTGVITAVVIEYQCFDNWCKHVSVGSFSSAASLLCGAGLNSSCEHDAFFFYWIFLFTNVGPFQQFIHQNIQFLQDIPVIIFGISAKVFFCLLFL